MSTLFPFTLAIPQGVYATILLVFVGLGTLSTLLLTRRSSGGAGLIAAVHCTGGVLALLAQDLMTLLIGWEVLSFSAFLLIRRRGTRKNRKIAYRYIAIQVTAAVLFFTAAIVQWWHTGSLMITVLVPDAQGLILLAVLIKTASVPVHQWLVHTYPMTDPLVTLLLSVFTTKVGVITAARLIEFNPGGVPVVAWIGGITALVAVIYALQQHNARRLLSYHIVSQVGYMIAGIGLAAHTAGLFHLVTHTLYKGLLILVAAEAIRLNGHELLSRMRPLRFRHPLLLMSAVVGAIAISGVPFTSGYGSKYLLKDAAATVPAIQWLLLLASVGTGLSFIKFVFLIFFHHPEEANTALEQEPVSGAEQNSPDHLIGFVMTVLVLVTVLIGLFPNRVSGVPDLSFFTPAALIGAMQPLVGSVVLWVLLRRFLITDHEKRSPVVVPLRLRLVGKMKPPARLLHEVGPQLQIFVILLVFMVLVVVLR